jgi:hypothetical protein
MTPATEHEPLFERFTVRYPSGTVVMGYYCGGVSLAEARVTHPMAVVEASRIRG